MTVTLKKKPIIREELPSGRPSKWSRLLRAMVRNVVWSIGTLIVSLIVLELAFRACGIGGEEYLKVEPVVGYTHLENKQIVVRSEGWSYDSTNSQGNRDVDFPVTPAPGVHRVAFLGDSKTESLQVPIQDNFVREIERRLNGNSDQNSNPNESASTSSSNTKFECLNFGMSGYGTAQEVLQFMQDVRRYKPEVTVLVYHVLDNDENTAPVSFDTPRPSPYFSVTDEGILKPDWLFLDAWFCSEKAVYFRAFDWLRRNSCTLGVLSQIDRGMAGNKVYNFYSKRVLIPTLEFIGNKIPSTRYKPDPSTAAQRASLSQEFSKPIPRWGSTIEEKLPDRSSPQFVQNDYKVLLLTHRLHFRVTAALIRKLNAVCNESGSKLVVAALPAPSSCIFYFRELAALKQIAKEENFAFFNIHEKFPETAASESSPLFVGFHFSRKGHQVIADLVTPIVEQQFHQSKKD